MEFNSILERQNRRTLSISITRDGLVKIKAPISMPISEIKSFVHDKQGWIREKLLAISNIIDENKDITSYERFLFLGQKCTPYWADVNSFAFDIERKALILPKKLSGKIVMPNICRFYRKKAKEILSQRVISICETMNVSPGRIRISNAKSRWGSCNSNKVVSLNWRLIMLPTKLIDYVIVHELAHLKHMDHSNRFWNEVETYVPDYGFLRKDLKKYSFVLDLFR